MTAAPVVILGAGGHARVVADALLAAGRTVLGLIDARPGAGDDPVTRLPVLGSDADLLAGQWPECEIANGLGLFPLRERLQRTLEDGGRRFTGVIHPSAIVSRLATLDPTAQVLARAVVQPGAWIGPGCIVNTGAVVEHDCRIGDFTHCAPGSILCGDVRTGVGVHVGAGAVIREGVTAGPGLVIGAGAVMVKDHPGPGVLAGVPARPVDRSGA